MANTTTGLIPILYSAAQTVAGELVGIQNVIRQNFDAKSAGLNQTIRVPISPTQSGSDFTPAQTVTVGSDRSLTYVDVTLTKNRFSSFHITGEEDRALTAGGNDIAAETFKLSIMQAMRTMRNEVEADCAALYKQAHLAIGTAGTTPFSSDVSAVASAVQLMNLAGMPDDGGRWMCIGSAAALNMRKLAQLLNQYQAGDTNMLRRGIFGQVYGVEIAESAQIASHTKGTGTGYLINNASGEAVGNTALTVDTGSGTVVAGDVITHASDSTYNYVVGTALASNTITLNRLGLKVAAANNDAITVGNNYTANMFGHRDAAVVVTRPPAIDPTPIIETQLVPDAKTGLTFLVCRCPGDGLVTYRVHLAWGVKAVQPEFLFNLRG